MLIYSGWGLLSPVIYFAVFLGLYISSILFTGDSLYAYNQLFFGFIILALSTAATFLAGKFLNLMKPLREIVKDGKLSHEEFTKHTLYHIPFEWSGFLISAVVIIFLLLKKMNFL